MLEPNRTKTGKKLELVTPNKSITIFTEIRNRLEQIEAALTGINSPWLNISNAAKYAQVSGTTLRRWIDSGKLPARRVENGRLLIHRRDIDSLLLFGETKLNTNQRKILNAYSEN